MATSRAPYFDLDTALHGRLTIHRLNVGALVKVLADFNRARTSGPGPAADTLVALLVAALGRRQDGSEVTLEDAQRLNEDERIRFAELFLEHSQLLQSPEASSRGEGEDAKAFLARALPRIIGRNVEAVPATSATSEPPAYLFSPPPDPAKETNKRLDHLEKVLNEVRRALADLTAEMRKLHSTQAERTDKALAAIAELNEQLKSAR